MAHGGKRRLLRGVQGGWVPVKWLVLCFLLLGARITFAQWDFTRAGDPNRNWGAVVTESVGYDDNFNATERNRQSGVRLDSDIKLRASVPLERLFLGMQYDYAADYPRDANLGGVSQTHNLTASANYTVTPRLTLGLTENFVNSLQPELVVNISHAPVTVVQAGTYIYDNVGGAVNYSLTSRWILSLNGSWDIWRYQSASIASNSDHEDYSATLSALYALDTRTTVGLNYLYGQNVFVNPGPNNGLNAISHTVYLSGTRRFNPRLSLTLNGGYTIRDSADGTRSTSPSALAALVYNYGPDSTITVNLAQSLSSATVGVDRRFSAQQNTSASLQVSHRVVARLQAAGDITYTYSSFTAPLGAITVSPNDQALTVHLGLRYNFRQWLAVVTDYTHTELVSSDATLVQPFARNQVSAGVSLTY